MPVCLTYKPDMLTEQMLETGWPLQKFYTHLTMDRLILQEELGEWFILVLCSSREWGRLSPRHWLYSGGGGGRGLALVCCVLRLLSSAA